MGLFKLMLTFGKTPPPLWCQWHGPPGATGRVIIHRHDTHAPVAIVFIYIYIYTQTWCQKYLEPILDSYTDTYTEYIRRK